MSVYTYGEYTYIEWEPIARIHIHSIYKYSKSRRRELSMPVYTYGGYTYIDWAPEAHIQIRSVYI